MKVLAIGAHPDDIEIGAGGVLAKHAKKGDKITFLIVTIPQEKEKRRKECEQAAALFNAKLVVLDLDAKEVIFNRVLVQKFDEVIGKEKPDLIYTSWLFDSHQDHRAVTNATISATRKNECSVLMYEQTIPGGIVVERFRAQKFVDISNEMETKIKAVLLHKTQVDKNTENWIEGLKGLATWRGFQIGVKFAESFEVLKIIEK